MRISIITVGKLRLSFAREGFEQYIKRLGGFHQVSVNHVKEGKDCDQKIKDLTDGSYVVLMDEKGALYTSRSLATWLDKLEHEYFHVSFVFGGPDGHSDAVRTLSTDLWSLSPLTLPHDLSVMFVSEALYRGATINANHPYHRE